MRVIYIDELFLINFAADYFLLLGAAKICGAYAKRRRIILGALSGGAYACLGVVPGLTWLAHPLMWIPMGFVMLIAAFSISRCLIKIGIVFAALSAAAAGVVYSVSEAGGNALAKLNLRVLIISFGAAYIIITLVMRRSARPQAEYAVLTIFSNGRKLCVRALRDTGNALMDPANGKPCVIIPAYDAVELIEGRDRAAIEASLKKPAHDAIFTLAGFSATRFRIVPYSAVGVCGGSLLAFSPDRICVDNKPVDAAICLSPYPISDNNSYSAVIPAVLPKGGKKNAARV